MVRFLPLLRLFPWRSSRFSFQAALNRLPVLCRRWFSEPSVVPGTSAAGAAQGFVASYFRSSVLVYLTKFLAADMERLVLTGDVLGGADDVHFVGLCGIFNGTLMLGIDLHVMDEDG